MKTIRKEIKHYFNDEEINEMAKEMSQNIEIRKSKVDEKDSFNRQIKSSIDELEKQNEVLAKYINSGFKSEFKECRVENNYGTGKILFTDIETGEVLDVELMDGWEEGRTIFGLDEDTKVEVTLKEANAE